MPNSSILGGERAPHQAAGKDVDALGPSDSSDSGSDVQGEREMPTAPDNPGEWGALVTGGQTDTDAAGTGERSGADGQPAVDGADIMPDRIVTGAAADAGLSVGDDPLRPDDLLADEEDAQAEDLDSDDPSDV